MYKVTVTKKTGFRIADPSKPVVIRDNRHILFYSTESQTPKINCFNLPGFGTFWIEEGNIKPLEKPIHYPHAKIISSLERVRENPFDFAIEFGINKNKCTIKWDEKEILFDSSFLEKPLPDVFFILGHEYGHAFKVPYEIASNEARKKGMTIEQYYESVCDEISGNYMKTLGFNPSQICKAPFDALSERQELRKTNMYESLQSAQ